jgi:ERCC4-type nuclease
VIVSSSEPVALRKLGTAGQKPEDFGVDYLWFVPHERGWAGVQRKEVDDLFASVRDGRLTKEIGQWGDLCNVMLLIEGSLEYINGNIQSIRNPRNNMSLDQWDAMMWRIQSTGAKTNSSMGHSDSSTTITRFQAWTKKDRHTSLSARPGANLTSSWRSATSTEMKSHLLQGFPSIGPELAGRIIDHFGGIPLRWAVTAADLEAIPGIGPKRANELVSMLVHGEEAHARRIHPAGSDLDGIPRGADLAAVVRIHP